METQSTLYVKLIDNETQSSLLELIQEGELNSNSLKSLLDESQFHFVDALFKQSEIDCYFTEEANQVENYIVTSLVASNGSEDDYLPLIEFLNNAFPDCEARIKGQGEEFYLFFIRNIHGSIELKHWEEGDPEELLELLQWFNKGLPDSLQENEIDFFY